MSHGVIHDNTLTQTQQDRALVYSTLTRKALQASGGEGGGEKAHTPHRGWMGQAGGQAEALTLQVQVHLYLKSHPLPSEQTAAVTPLKENKSPGTLGASLRGTQHLQAPGKVTHPQEIPQNMFRNLSYQLLLFPQLWQNVTPKTLLFYKHPCLLKENAQNRGEFHLKMCEG